MMRLAIFVVALAVASSARAERLTIAVSTPDVQIRSNFAGTAVTVFGVIDQNAQGSIADNHYGVAVVIVGPSQSVVARRKDRVLGVWANRASQTIINAPTFYSLNTNGAVDTLANPAVLQRLQIGFDNLGLTYEGRGTINDPGATEFRDAFIRLKQRAGLFNQQIGVSFVGDLIFRTTTWLPANIPVGRYTVLVYLFSGGELLANAVDKIEVTKSGVEETMSAFARNQSLIYGLLCVALALFVGWLGGVIFRRD